ncbi:MAG: hypothetical protein ACI4MF_10775, partial [Candidatus Faecivicinus sp.]
MAGRRQTVEKYEERGGSGKAGRILGAVALYGAMLLLGYIVLATPEAGTAMGAIRDVLCGLGGTLAIVIPLIFGWAATLLALAAAGRKVSVWRSAVDGVLFVCLFTAVQLVVAEDVIHNRMTIMTFANFVNKSYSYGAGGGAIGALLAWPLYGYLGKVGGILATILLAVLSLTATGKLQKLAHWAGDRADDIQHGTEQRRMERENERMFDVEAPRPRRRREIDPAGDGIQLSRDPRAERSGTLIDDAPFGKELAPDDGPSMAAFDGSRRRASDRKAQADIPESLKDRPRRRPGSKPGSEAEAAGGASPESAPGRPDRPRRPAQGEAEEPNRPRRAA